jgi:single-strand selective monofunctional uracil DNA glycosylase
MAESARTGVARPPAVRRMTLPISAPEQPAAQGLAAAARDLAETLDQISFRPERRWIYNTLSYAFKPYQQYLCRYITGRRRVLFLGMNPGPWGMVQTGIPFGEIPAVTQWLAIDAPIGRPEHEHPKRPVTGYACTRSEVSGRRLWSLMQRRFGTPAAFFSDHAVLNYCPLVFMEDSGRNITPDKLTAQERGPLEAACDRHLAKVIGILRPEWVVGIGTYAERQIIRTVEAMERGTPASAGDGGGWTVKVSSVLHPSPASPAANRGWEQQCVAQLSALGIWSA